MRLIDADELKVEVMKALLFSGDFMAQVAVAKAIDDAPTVDQWHYPSRGELPDKTDDYLVYLERDGVGNIIIATYYVGAEEWCYCGDEMLEPVAWMPYCHARSVASDHTRI